MPENFLRSKTETAIIVGIKDFNPVIFSKTKEIKIKTQFGYPTALIRIVDFLGKKSIFMSRHGRDIQLPPHKINYKANLQALKKLGVRYIFSFNSVGSLKKKIKPGNIVVISDYIDFDPPTFYEKNPQFITPKISDKLRGILIRILKKLNLKFFEKGVYFNTKGPRLETKAEINLIKNFADVVAMTMAKEATLADELGLEYASICLIDNYAHGLVKKSLSMKDIREHQARNKKNIERIVEKILRTEI